MEDTRRQRVRCAVDRGGAALTRDGLAFPWPLLSLLTLKPPFDSNRVSLVIPVPSVCVVRAFRLSSGVWSWVLRW